MQPTATAVHVCTSMHVVVCTYAVCMLSCVCAQMLVPLLAVSVLLLYTSIDPYQPHALLNERVTPGLADHEIGPLHNDNGCKERCVACVLEHFAVGVSLKTHPLGHNTGKQPYIM